MSWAMGWAMGGSHHTVPRAARGRAPGMTLALSLGCARVTWTDRRHTVGRRSAAGRADHRHRRPRGPAGERPRSRSSPTRSRRVPTGLSASSPATAAAGIGVDDWDQAVARLVVAGDLDLGMIPARAWDTEGVSTLRALTTPLLVTGEDHMDAVVPGRRAVAGPHGRARRASASRG